ncbi:hypothetical protein GPALN_005546 [Globodera pallida]|uniref:BTD domain-containing protein n=1 Tax=Globodera pallida TaxID=36090 RepID=A0A183BHQ5_GLOPA|nr:hypothetical protein GPALN_005546 [Globodera pallida]
MLNGAGMAEDQQNSFVSGSYSASCSTSYVQHHLQQQHLIVSYKAPHQKLTPERMREYLRNREDLDCVLEIYHPKVAQKSYGTEKRFFSPPPLVYLRGRGWRWRWILSQNGSDKMLDIPSIRFNELSNDFPEPIAHIGIVGSKDQEKHKLDWQKDRDGRCAIKSLHISENDNNRKKYFTLSVHCTYETPLVGFCQKLGVFESKRIKVISKPSKKKLANNKQSDIKNQGINIASGTEVALFSRVRSQTTNTRYLFVKEGKFVANSKFWGSFTIHLIDEQQEDRIDPDADDFHVRDGYINYGSIVKMVDSVSGLALPMMRICKVEKCNGTDVVVVSDGDSGEQVSQLHKCGFQMLSAPEDRPLFMCFNGENIVQQDVADRGIAAHDDQLLPERRYSIRDGAQWTIISTDTIQYRFFEALRPVQTEVAPIPIVCSLDMHSIDSNLPSNAYVELIGHDFYPDLQAWLGSTPMPTNFINKELIRFTLLPLNQLHLNEGVDYVLGSRHSLSGGSYSPSASPTAASSPAHYRSLLNGSASAAGVPFDADQEMEFPLSLVRDDGVIYTTQLSVSYSRPRDQQFRTAVPRVI